MGRASSSNAMSDKDGDASSIKVGPKSGKLTKQALKRFDSTTARCKICDKLLDGERYSRKLVHKKCFLRKKHFEYNLRQSQNSEAHSMAIKKMRTKIEMIILISLTLLLDCFICRGSDTDIDTFKSFQGNAYFVFILLFKNVRLDTLFTSSTIVQNLVAILRQAPDRIIGSTGSEEVAKGGTRCKVPEILDNRRNV